ncbi:MAG: peptidylprolyl isomerase [Bacteroidales bacterium]|nr:peptidylprolyl isomerase [Bacteroidales bacterium]
MMVAGLTLTSCGNRSSKQGETAQQDETTMNINDDFIPENVTPETLLDVVTSEGTIRIKLYEDTSKHRENFLKLASEGFYDNVLFHRVINGFMIQTGDPLTKSFDNPSQYGTGGPGYTIPAEILPHYTHKKGALAAARQGDFVNPRRESSGSQFYLVHDPKHCVHLDGQYTIFGETVEGLDVIDAIAAKRTNPNDRPLEDVRILCILPVTNN